MYFAPNKKETDGEDQDTTHVREAGMDVRVPLLPIKDKHTNIKGPLRHCSQRCRLDLPHSAIASQPQLLLHPLRAFGKSRNLPSASKRNCCSLKHKKKGFVRLEGSPTNSPLNKIRHSPSFSLTPRGFMYLSEPPSEGSSFLSCVQLPDFRITKLRDLTIDSNKVGMEIPSSVSGGRDIDPFCIRSNMLDAIQKENTEWKSSQTLKNNLGTGVPCCLVTEYTEQKHCKSDGLNGVKGTIVQYNKRHPIAVARTETKMCYSCMCFISDPSQSSRYSCLILKSIGARRMKQQSSDDHEGLESIPSFPTIVKKDHEINDTNCDKQNSHEGIASNNNILLGYLTKSSNGYCFHELKITGLRSSVTGSKLQVANEKVPKQLFSVSSDNSQQCFGVCNSCLVTETNSYNSPEKRKNKLRKCRSRQFLEGKPNRKSLDRTAANRRKHSSNSCNGFVDNFDLPINSGNQDVQEGLGPRHDLGKNFILSKDLDENLNLINDLGENIDLRGRPTGKRDHNIPLRSENTPTEVSRDRRCCDTKTRHPNILVSVKSERNLSKKNNVNDGEHRSFQGQRRKCVPTKYSDDKRCSRRIKSDVWVWLRLVLVILWAGASLHTAHGSETTRNGCANVTEPRECIRNFDLRNHASNLKDLCYCTKVIGQVHINLINTENNHDSLVLNSFSFVHLREITGYLLVANMKTLTSLSTMFPNLTVIRGSSVFHNYALLIYNLEDLQEVGLYSLKSILRGSVCIVKNRNLCHVNAGDWDSVTTGVRMGNLIRGNKQNCGPNERGCLGSKRCRNHTSSPIVVSCRGCRGGCINGTCCHDECLGGCTSPGNATTCVACRNVWHKGTCRQSCPKDMYKAYDWGCLSEKECLTRNLTPVDDRNGPDEVKICVDGRNYVCKPGKENNCASMNIVSLQTAKKLAFCTCLDVLTITISGDERVEEELSRHLSKVERITGYLKIFRTNITSMAILKNLKEIEGRITFRKLYSLYVMENPRLKSLDPWLSTMTSNSSCHVQKRVMFQKNPLLCLSQVHKLVEPCNITDKDKTEDISTSSNNNGIWCNEKTLEVTIWPSLEYGTLLLNMETQRSVDTSRYIINYQEASENIKKRTSLCPAIGWSVKEGTVGAVNITTNITANITNLAPNTRYAVYVIMYQHLKPEVQVNHSAQHLKPDYSAVYSKIIYARTAQFNPSQPVKLSWAPGSDSELSVWWSLPLSPNGVLDHYMVTAVRLPSPTQDHSSTDYCNSYSEEQLEESSHRLQETWNKRLKEEVKQQRTKEKQQKKKLPREGRCCNCKDGKQEIEKLKKGTQHFKLGASITFEQFLNNGARCHPLVQDDDQHLNTCGNSSSTRGGVTQHLRYHSERSPLDEAVIEEKEEKASSGIQEQLYSLHDINYNRGDELHPVGFQHTDRTKSRGYSLRGGYVEHDSGEFYPELDNETGSFVVSRQMTKNLSVTLENLSPSSVYSISVVACLTPTNCTKQWTNNAFEEVPCKLCSIIPATVAAITLPNNKSDVIPEGSLKAEVQNDTNTVKLSWDPPKTSNGLVLFYQVQYVSQESVKEFCLNNREFENKSRSVSLDLDPGNYTISVTVGSQVTDYIHPAIIRRVGSQGNDFRHLAIIRGVYIPWRAKAEYIHIVWSILGTLMVMMFVVCLGIGGWKCYKAKNPSQETVVGYNPSYKEGFEPSKLFYEAYLLSRSDLKVLDDKPLGSGHCSNVFQGELSEEGKTSRRVAAKTLKGCTTTRKEVLAFLQEAVIMQNLDSHHIVKLLGVVADYEPVYIVMELMPRMDLQGYLRSQKPNQISEQQILYMALQAADGMAYLESQGIVHCDLAARNCLLDEDMTLKISDLGLARTNGSNCQHRDGSGARAFRWMAPESLKSSQYSSKSDVWSYGVLLWEMYNGGATPFQGLDVYIVMYKIVREKETLHIPESCHEVLGNFMRKCWKYDPAFRPTFSKITERLFKEINNEEFLYKFERQSFFGTTRNESPCRRRDSEDGFMTKITKEEDHDRLMNSSSEFSEDSNMESEAIDHCVVSAQVECLLPCNHPHCPHTELSSQNTSVVSHFMAENCAPTNTNAATAMPRLALSLSEPTGTKIRCSTSFCLGDASQSCFHNGPTDHHHIYANTPTGEQPRRASQTPRHPRWSEYSEETVRLIRSPTTPSRDDMDTPLWPCEAFNGVQGICCQSLETSGLPMAISTHSKNPKTIPTVSTNWYRNGGSSPPPNLRPKFSPLKNDSTRASAPATPSITFGKSLSLSRKRPQVRSSSYTLVTANRVSDPLCLNNNKLGYLDAPLLNASTPLLTHGDTKLKVTGNHAAPALTPLMGVKQSPTSSVPEFTMTPTKPLPTSASKPSPVTGSPATTTPNLTEPMFPAQQWQMPQLGHSQFSESHNTALEFVSYTLPGKAVFPPFHSLSHYPTDLPKGHNLPSPTTTSIAPQHHQLQQQFPASAQPSASTLPKKMFSSVLRSDLPSGQSGTSSGRQSPSSCVIVGVGRRNTTELELM